MNKHIVEFDKYCSTCKHKDLEEEKDPCNECLNEPFNEDSRRPVNYDEK